jgi:predicted tellurium resistance membrane protein TerC
MEPRVKKPKNYSSFLNVIIDIVVIDVIFVLSK